MSFLLFNINSKIVIVAVMDIIINLLLFMEQSAITLLLLLNILKTAPFLYSLVLFYYLVSFKF
ncbi:hypothetical protein CP368_02585 [Lactobacillus sp. UMNPBX17]|nr:hypothetical protein B5E95_02915 [Lactobacillus gallinarum]PEG81687.1 hypothetical protein CP368_02585 [Lactobacillus sp. UMNPBX17]